MITTYSFHGDETTEISSFSELQGKTIVSIRYTRWMGTSNPDIFPPIIDLDLGGRIDIDVNDSQPPILHVTDLLMSTPKVKDDPLEAMQEAIAESKKGGQKKSMGLMMLSQMKFTEHLIKRMEQLDKDVSKMQTEIDNLKKKVK